MPKPSKLRKGIAVVTGAGQGIGAAIARSLAEGVYTVAAVDISEAQLARLQRALRRAGQDVHVYTCDVASSSAVAATLERVEEELGGITVLVNNAGVGGPFHRVDEVTDAEWDWIFGTNVKSVLHFARVLLPKMRRRGFGRIINIASIHGLFGAAKSSTYVASKHAMIGYTKAIAVEWGAFGITCNAICPGYVETRMGVQDGEVSGHRKRVLSRTPVGRVASTAEIAHLVLSLADPMAGYVNGSVIVADGGITADVGVS